MDIKKLFDLMYLWINTIMRITGLMIMLTQVSVAAFTDKVPSSPSTWPAVSAVGNGSVDRAINIALIGIIILLILINRRSKNLQNRELDKLKKELEQAQKKQLESQDEGIDQKLSKLKHAKTPAEHASASGQQQSSRYRLKNTPYSKHNMTEPTDETIQIQNASTILNTASVLDLQREQRIKEILSLYRAMIDNLRINDLKDFCQQQNVINAKQTDSNSSRETVLELINDQPCNEADLWVIPDTTPEHYLVLPGATIISECNSLHVENAHILRKVFRGIMIIVPNSSFELIKPGLAKKLGDILIITSMGKLGLPLEARKR